MMKKLLLALVATVLLTACAPNHHAHAMSKPDLCLSLYNRINILEQDHARIPNWQYQRKHHELRSEYHNNKCHIILKKPS